MISCYSSYKAGHSLSEIAESTLTFLTLSATFYLHLWSTSLSVWYVRILVLLYGVMTCKLLLHLMIAHVTAQKFRSMRVSILSTCAIVWTFFALPKTLRPDEATMVWALLFANLFGKMAMR